MADERIHKTLVNLRKEAYVNSPFFETKVRNHLEKQVHIMQNWTIDKVVEMKKVCIGVSY